MHYFDSVLSHDHACYIIYLYDNQICWYNVIGWWGCSTTEVGKVVYVASDTTWEIKVCVSLCACVDSCGPGLAVHVGLLVQVEFLQVLSCRPQPPKTCIKVHETVAMKTLIITTCKTCELQMNL